ncbi:MAG TPA: RecB family exonuclease, partial [Mycobacterium sp.]|nr:RecB family exonuclease [Mycobacterium sp.]
MSAAPAESRIRRPALSPSRAADFKQCPLLYRFRAIDRLPEPSSVAQLRGSVVHGALERLYALPAPQRGPETAQALVASSWDQLISTEPGLDDGLDTEQLLAEARKLLSGYYRLEDPRRFDPQSCEQRIEVELADGTPLRGFVDRIDVAPTGELRVVDYKTGRAPSAAGGRSAAAESKALFQMKFYAVALLRSRGVLPARLRLIYLADGQLLDYSPDHAELLRFEKTLIAIWQAIQTSGATGDFRP